MIKQRNDYNNQKNVSYYSGMCIQCILYFHPTKYTKPKKKKIGNRNDRSPPPHIEKACLSNVLRNVLYSYYRLVN